MFRRIFYFVPALSFVLAGCAANTFETLVRDEAALFADIADSMMKIVDEDSAEYFIKKVVPRWEIRAKTHKERISMWDKYANEEDKKKLATYIKAMKGAFKREFELDEATFDTHHLFFTAREEVSASSRAVAEQYRIARLVAKLEERMMFDIQKQWNEEGRKEIPRIGRGLEVDADKEWPNLVKARTAAKDLGLDLGAVR